MQARPTRERHIETISGRLRQVVTGAGAACLVGAASAQDPQAPEAPPEAPEGTGRAILVMDASNSMWGQIDGTAKIEIAREAVTGLLDRWNPGVELGLMAYGHRREGDCIDIELIAPVGAERSVVEAALTDLTPRGKTPMTDAVAQAAQALSYTDTPATVILVSDGRETCNADPCAVASDLEQSGVAFTAHVVGFDVADEETIAQLQCIADNTGGRYVAADSAEELSQALSETGGAAADATLRLRAVEGEDGPVIRNGVQWTIAGEDPDADLPEAEGARPDLSLPPGSYTATAQRDEESAEGEITLAAGETGLLTLTFTLPEASLDAPAEIAAGSSFTINYTGPAGERDYITYVEPETPEGRHGPYDYAEEESGEAELRAPDATGEYELRFVSEAGRTLASTPFTVTEVTAGVSAPERVEAGTAFDIDWTGPANEYDYITIVETGTPEGRHGDRAYVEDSASSVTMRAPDQAGAWEVRYVSGGDAATLARAGIEVDTPDAALDAPASVGAGSAFDIAWTGPDSEGDFLTIVEPDTPEGRHGDREDVEDTDGIVTMRAPDAPGTWELRYLSGGDYTTFARTTLEIEPADAAISAPASVPAGASFIIEWTGPENEGDYLTLVEPETPEGRYGEYEYVEETGGAVTMTAPDEPGPWEIRYLSGGDDATFARTTITVEPFEDE